MNLLEQLLNHVDQPRHADRTLTSDLHVWLVTCALGRRENFGLITTEAAYEVVAENEEEAQAAVRSCLIHSHPHDSLRSIQTTRQPQH